MSCCLLETHIYPLPYIHLFVLRRCFLVTFYFTQELLPSIAVPNAEGDKASVKPNDAVEFVKSYGAYLNLHLSLVSSAAFKADSVIEKLLALAKFDPRHQEVKKQLSKSNSLVLYDPVRDLDA